MRRPFIAVALLVIAVFGIGYVIGQIRGVTPSAAATSGQSQSGVAANGAVDRFGPRVAGKVTAVNGNTITISPSVGWRVQQASVTTVLLTSSTQYLAGRNTAATKDAIKVGSFIVAQGTLSSDGKTLTATRVFVLPSVPVRGAFGRVAGPGVVGKVTAISGDTVTISPLTRRNGQTSSVTTIDLTASTQYLAKPGTTANRSSIKVGSYIAARGTLSRNGKALTASQVRILPAAPTVIRSPRAAGQVTAISGNTVTIRPGVGWKRGASSVTTVVLTSNTQYETRSASGPTSTNRSVVKVGSYIIAEGTLSADGKTLTASRVLILPSAPMFGQFHQYGQFGQFIGQPGPSV